jgi:hypothetical protein
MKRAFVVALTLAAPASVSAERWAAGGLAFGAWQGFSFGPSAAAGLRVLDERWFALEVATVHALRWTPVSTSAEQGSAEVSGSRWYYDGVVEAQVIVPARTRVRFRAGPYGGVAWFHQHSTLTNEPYGIARDYSSGLATWDVGLAIAVELQVSHCASVDLGGWLTARPNESDGPTRHRWGLSLRWRF